MTSRQLERWPISQTMLHLNVLNIMCHCCHLLVAENTRLNIEWSSALADQHKFTKRVLWCQQTQQCCERTSLKNKWQSGNVWMLQLCNSERQGNNKRVITDAIRDCTSSRMDQRALFLPDRNAPQNYSLHLATGSMICFECKEWVSQLSLLLSLQDWDCTFLFSDWSRIALVWVHDQVHHLFLWWWLKMRLKGICHGFDESFLAFWRSCLMSAMHQCQLRRDQDWGLCVPMMTCSVAQALVHTKCLLMQPRCLPKHCFEFHRFSNPNQFN